jgi:hypothetical protein
MGKFSLLLFIKRKIKHIRGIYILIGSVFVISFLIIGQYCELKIHGKYTIGKTLGIEKARNYYFSYEYFVNQKRYFSCEGITSSEAKNYNLNGGKYLVRFSPNLPIINEIMLDYPMYDSIVLPVNGWDSIP